MITAIDGQIRAIENALARGAGVDEPPLRAALATLCEVQRVVPTFGCFHGTPYADGACRQCGALVAVDLLALEGLVRAVEGVTP